MNKKLYTVETENIKIFLSLNYINDNTNFNIEYFILKNDEEHIFSAQNSAYNCPNLKNRKFVYLREYIFNIYKKMADKQLAEFIESNINNYDFYLNNISKDIINLPNINILDNIEKKINSRFANVNFSEFINSGIIQLEFKYISCYYNLISQKHICFKSDNKNMDISSLDFIYSGEEYKLLAFEQYKRNKAPHAYIELMKLNCFLKDKASVKLVMKNNEIYTYNNKGSILTAHDLIYLLEDSPKFEFASMYYLTPKPSTEIKLDDLDYLQYRQTKHKINLNTKNDFKPINQKI